MNESELADAAAAADRARRGQRIAVLVAASVALVLVAVVAFMSGRLNAPPTESTPGNTSVEAGFARDMQVHHQQGAELATMVRDVTGDPELRLLAYDIAATQTQQAGQMYGWLRAWGLPQAGQEPSMTWMTHGSSTGHASMGGSADPMAMPGLATPEQIEQLDAATGVEAERIFLELMMAHHRGAIDMANAVLPRTSNPAVVELAESIIESQTAEMQVMEQMLSDRL